VTNILQFQRPQRRPQNDDSLLLSIEESAWDVERKAIAARGIYDDGDAATDAWFYTSYRHQGRPCVEALRGIRKEIRILRTNLSHHIEYIVALNPGARGAELVEQHLGRIDSTLAEIVEAETEVASYESALHDKYVRGRRQVNSLYAFAASIMNRILPVRKRVRRVK